MRSTTPDADNGATNAFAERGIELRRWLDDCQSIEPLEIRIHCRSVCAREADGRRARSRSHVRSVLHGSDGTV